MVKQSGFAGGEIASQYPDLVYGEDYDFFMFPGVKGVQGGADYMFVFNDTPAVQAIGCLSDQRRRRCSLGRSGIRCFTECPFRG